MFLKQALGGNVAEGCVPGVYVCVCFPKFHVRKDKCQPTHTLTEVSTSSSVQDSEETSHEDCQLSWNGKVPVIGYLSANQVVVFSREPMGGEILDNILPLSHDKGLGMIGLGWCEGDLWPANEERVFRGRRHGCSCWTGRFWRRGQVWWPGRPKRPISRYFSLL